MKEQITYDIFDKVDIRVGTVISVKKNQKARKPSLVVEVDFGGLLSDAGYVPIVANETFVASAGPTDYAFT